MAAKPSIERVQEIIDGVMLTVDNRIKNVGQDVLVDRLKERLLCVCVKHLQGSDSVADWDAVEVQYLELRQIEFTKAHPQKETM
jgi:hypothetical protein